MDSPEDSNAVICLCTCVFKATLLITDIQSGQSACPPFEDPSTVVAGWPAENPLALLSFLTFSFPETMFGFPPISENPSYVSDVVSSSHLPSQCPT